MRIVHDKIEGDTLLTLDTKLHGMIVGNVTVGANVTLELHGMIVGTLTLEARSRVFLHGMVTSSVANRGGQLEVWGMVHGHIARDGGVTIVHPHAAVLELPL